MPSIYKRMRQEGIGTAEPTNYTLPIIPKVYATMNCVWCPNDFDRFRIVCNQCHNCQYCGMVADSQKRCQLCGNELPDDLKEDVNNHKHKIRFF